MGIPPVAEFTRLAGSVGRRTVVSQQMMSLTLAIGRQIEGIVYWPWPLESVSFFHQLHGVGISTLVAERITAFEDTSLVQCVFEANLATAYLYDTVPTRSQLEDFSCPPVSLKFHDLITHATAIFWKKHGFSW